MVSSKSLLIIHWLITIVASFHQPTPKNQQGIIIRTVAPLQPPVEIRQDLLVKNTGCGGDHQQKRTIMNSKSDGNLEVTNDSSSWKWLFTLVIPLHFVYISNQWSRSSIYYLVNFSDDATPFSAMNVDIGFSQSQYGVLASLAFTALFAFASLGAGAASDRFDRKKLTVVAALGWGVATLGTALSSSYTEVLSWRVLMGLACAFTTPTAYTLINDRVPDDRKSLATSFYGTGVALGGALASLSILLDNNVGWQQTTLLISCVAFASAILALIVLPPDRKREEVATITKSTLNETDQSQETRSFVKDISEVLSTERARWLFLGTFLRFSAGLSIGVWSASYYKMTFPDHASEYAVAQALITAIAGSTSGLLGGAIADWLAVNASENEDVIGKKLWIPVVGSILAAPTFYMAMHADSFQLAMIWLSVEYLVAECWFGPTISSMLATVGSKVGGTGQGLFTLTGAVANLAPTALGWLYSTQNDIGQTPELNVLLSYVVCFAYLSSAFCFAISAQKSTFITLKGKQV